MARTLTRAKAVALRLQFTADEQRIVQQAADAVWNEVAYDLLTDGMGEEAYVRATGRRPRSVRRSEVIEVVCDANRLEEHIRDRALRQRVSALDTDLLYALVTPAFPYQWYGL